MWQKLKAYRYWILVGMVLLAIGGGLLFWWLKVNPTYFSFTGTVEHSGEDGVVFSDMQLYDVYAQYDWIWTEIECHRVADHTYIFNFGDRNGRFVEGQRYMVGVKHHGDTCQTDLFLWQRWH